MIAKKVSKSQDRSEPEHLTILDSPEKRKKRFIFQIIISIVLLSLGIVIVYMGTIPSRIAVDSQVVYDDYDVTNQTFRSYDNGDIILISGKITDKDEARKLYNGTVTKFPGMDSEYRYELDDRVEFFASEDFGTNGDVIYVECEVKTDEFLDNGQYLKATYFYNIILYFSVGLLLIIIGIIILVFSYKKLKMSTSKKAIDAHKVAAMYKSMETKDEEDMMYLSLRSRPKKP